MAGPQEQLEPLKDTSGGASRGLAEALEAISPQHYQNKPVNPLQMVINYFTGQVENAMRQSLMAADQALIIVENPSSLVTAMPLVAELRMNRALKTIGSIPEGKVLVDALKQSGVKPEFINAPTYNGAYVVSTLSTDKNGTDKIVTNALKLPAYSNHGRLVSYLVHELQHIHQAQKGMLRLGVQKTVSPMESVWYERAIEADAKATSVDISYKLMKAGHPEAWNEMKMRRTASRDFIRAYEDAVKKDPQSVENGFAKRAAFDAWFDAKLSYNGDTVSRLYNDQGLSSYSLPNTPEKEARRPMAHLEAGDIRRLGTLSAVNYLELPGTRALDDPYYRKNDFDPFQAGWLYSAHREYQSKFFSKPAVEEAAPAPAMPSRSAFLPQGEGPNRPAGGMLSAIEPPPPQQQQPVQQAQAAAPVVRQAARSPGPGMRR